MAFEFTRSLLNSSIPQVQHVVLNATWHLAGQNVLRSESAVLRHHEGFRKEPARSLREAIYRPPADHGRARVSVRRPTTPGRSAGIGEEKRWISRGTPSARCATTRAA